MKKSLCVLMVLFVVQGLFVSLPATASQREKSRRILIDRHRRFSGKFDPMRYRTSRSFAPSPYQSSIDAALLGRNESGDGKDNEWLLEPDVFDLLSSGGRRGAIIKNGLLKDESPQHSLESLSLKSAAQPGSSNLRVNDPAMDKEEAWDF